MNYSWSFPQFIVNPQEGQLQNVIVGINWVCTGFDGNNSSVMSGTVSLGKPNPAQFVPYSEVTQEMAYQWVAQSISISGVEAEIAIQVAALSRPVLQPQNPPF